MPSAFLQNIVKHLTKWHGCWVIRVAVHQDIEPWLYREFSERQPSLVDVALVAQRNGDTKIEWHTPIFNSCQLMQRHADSFGHCRLRPLRSEEHTSELQSLRH